MKRARPFQPQIPSTTETGYELRDRRDRDASHRWPERPTLSSNRTHRELPPTFRLELRASPSTHKHQSERRAMVVSTIFLLPACQNQSRVRTARYTLEQSVSFGHVQVACYLMVSEISSTSLWLTFAQLNSVRLITRLSIQPHVNNK